MYSPPLATAVRSSATPADTSPCSVEAAGIASRLLRRVLARGRPQMRETVSTLNLPAGSTYALPVITGDAKIQLLEGIVWITREADSQDHVLSRPGQSFSANLRQHIILQPTSDARLILTLRTRL